MITVARKNRKSTSTSTTRSASRVTGRITGRNGNGNGHSVPAAPAAAAPSPAPAPAPAAQPCAAELELLAQRLEALRASAKQAYADADLVEASLISTLGVGGSVRLTDGRTLRVKDNFVDAAGLPRNVAYKPCGVRRFEVSVK